MNKKERIGGYEIRPELKPVLNVPVPKNWTLYYSKDDDGAIYGLVFRYKDHPKYCASIYAYHWSGRFETFIFGHEYKQFPTITEAIKRLKQLFTRVKYAYHWDEIASASRDKYRRPLIETIGIGKKTISKLVKAFGSLEKVKKATLKELEAILGVKMAWCIADYFSENIRLDELWSPTKQKWIKLYQVPKEVIDQCGRIHTYLTQSVRKKYRLTNKEIKMQGLVKVKKVK